MNATIISLGGRAPPAVVDRGRFVGHEARPLQIFELSEAQDVEEHGLFAGVTAVAMQLP
jgi:hypothetical protein